MTALASHERNSTNTLERFTLAGALHGDTGYDRRGNVPSEPAGRGTIWNVYERSWNVRPNLHLESAW